MIKSWRWDTASDQKLEMGYCKRSKAGGGNGLGRGGNGLGRGGNGLGMSLSQIYHYTTSLLSSVQEVHSAFSLQPSAQDELLAALLTCDIIVYDIIEEQAQVEEASWAVQGEGEAGRRRWGV